MTVMNSGRGANAGSGASAEPRASPGEGLDPRGPRFGAAITSVLLLVAVFLSLTTGSSVTPSALRSEPLIERLAQPAALALLVMFALFLWGATAGIRRHPFGILFAKVIRPRLGKPPFLEYPAPPTFAQAVGAVVVGLGLFLHLVGVPWALVIGSAAAFLAAFINAAFGFCLGCELYLVIRRLKPRRATA